jgi:DNA modification methylase
MKWCVRLVTPPGGLVLDLFAGSGTTGVAALAEGRRAVLVERVPEYCDIIRRRLSEPAGSLFATGRA